MTSLGTLTQVILPIIQDTSKNPYEELGNLIKSRIVRVDNPSFTYQLYTLWALTLLELIINLSVLAYHIYKNRDSLWLFRLLKVPSGTPGHYVLPRFPIAWLVVGILPLGLAQAYIKETIGNGVNEIVSARRGAVAYSLILFSLVWIASWLTIWSITISTCLIVLSSLPASSRTRSIITCPAFINSHFIGILALYIILVTIFGGIAGVKYDKGLDEWQEIVDLLNTMQGSYVPGTASTTVLIELQKHQTKLVQMIDTLTDSNTYFKKAWIIQFAFTVYVTILSAGNLAYQIYSLINRNIAQLSDAAEHNRRAQRLKKNVLASGFILLLISSYIWLAAYLSFTNALDSHYGREVGVLVGLWSFTILGCFTTILFSINMVSSIRHSPSQSTHEESLTARSKKSGQVSFSVSQNGFANSIPVEQTVVRVEMVGLGQREIDYADFRGSGDEKVAMGH